jgi:hypothetical protein
MLLGGCTLVFMYLDSTRGTVDANERVKDIVASALQASGPLELAQTEVTSVELVSTAMPSSAGSSALLS